MARDYSLPDTDFPMVLKGIVNKPDVVKRAFLLFKEEADIQDEPDIINFASDDAQMFFMEWLVFDFVYRRGKTPLELFVDHPGKSCSGTKLSIFRQAAQSQFCSIFWVVGVEREKGFTTLEDAATGNIYEVFDRSMARTLPAPEGMLGCRLMQVDGCWYFPGNPVFYYPVVPTDRLKKMFREDSALEACSFTHLLRDRFGAHDEENDSLREQLSMVDMTEEERAAHLETVADAIRGFHERGTIAATWEEIETRIRTSAEDENMLDLLTSFISGKSGDEPELSSEEEVSEVMTALFDAWNLLPHDSLGGKSPAQLANEM